MTSVFGCGILNVEFRNTNKNESEVNSLEKVQFDYSELSKRINTVLGSQGKYADALHLGRTSVNEGLNNKREWKQQEMIASANILGFPVSEIPKYFFAPKVQKHEQTI